MAPVSDAEYRKLLAFRTELRRFLGWSGSRATAAGLTPRQHQLLLAIKGHPEPAGPTVGELANYLVTRHHSVVELADRAEAAGLVQRRPDDEDHRVVRLLLTDDGERRIEELSQVHLEELARLAPLLVSLEEGQEGR